MSLVQTWAFPGDPDLALHGAVCFSLGSFNGHLSGLLKTTPRRFLLHTAQRRVALPRPRTGHMSSGETRSHQQHQQGTGRPASPARDPQGLHRIQTVSLGTASHGTEAPWQTRALCSMSAEHQNPSRARSLRAGPHSPHALGPRTLGRQDGTLGLVILLGLGGHPQTALLVVGD